MILSNVALFWAKLDPKNLDQGFDKNTPQYVVDIRTRDKAVVAEWKGLGFNPKVQDDDDGVFYSIKVKKPGFNKSGQENKPVPVFGGDLIPISDLGSIGNGTIANVKIHSFDYNFQGRKGIGFRLEAVQIVKLEVYAGSSSVTDGFAMLADADAGSDTSSDSAKVY